MFKSMHILNITTFILGAHSTTPWLYGDSPPQPEEMFQTMLKGAGVRSPRELVFYSQISLVTCHGENWSRSLNERPVSIGLDKGLGRDGVK